MAEHNGYSTTNIYTTPVAEPVRYAPVQEERPIGDLLQDLVNEGRRMVELELAQARTEMSQKASTAAKHAGFIAAGGFVIYAGFLAIIAAVIFGLANFIPLWLSALIVGVVVGLIGYALVRSGLNGLKHQTLAPKRTTESLKRDAEAVRQARATPMQPGGR